MTSILEKYRQTAEQLEKVQNQKKLREAKRKQIFRDKNVTFATEEGRRTLKWIMDFCGYNRSKLLANQETGEIQMQGTVYNAALEVVYLNIRKGLSYEILSSVEHRDPMADIDELLS